MTMLSTRDGVWVLALIVLGALVCALHDRMIGPLSGAPRCADCAGAAVDASGAPCLFCGGSGVADIDGEPIPPVDSPAQGS